MADGLGRHEVILVRADRSGSLFGKIAQTPADTARHIATQAAVVLSQATKKDPAQGGASPTGRMPHYNPNAAKGSECLYVLSRNNLVNTSTVPD